MLEFLIDNIFVLLKVYFSENYQHSSKHLLCSSLSLSVSLIHSYELECLQNLVKYKKFKKARSFSHIDILTMRISSSIYNPKFGEWPFPPELEIKETTDTASSVPILDLYLISTTVVISELKEKQTRRF